MWPKKDRPKFDFSLGLIAGLLIGSIVGAGLNFYITMYLP